MKQDFQFNMNRASVNKSACNSKQKQNLNECRCSCQELKDESSCNNDYIWNPSICDCQCNKVCNIDKYLDIKKCSLEKPVC